MAAVKPSAQGVQVSHKSAGLARIGSSMALPHAPLRLITREEEAERITLMQRTREAERRLAAGDFSAPFPGLTPAETSRLQVLHLLARRPHKLVAYPDAQGRVITSFGDTLGTIVQEGAPYAVPIRDRHSVRVRMRVRAISGDIYSGTFYVTTGYAALFRI